MWIRRKIIVIKVQRLPSLLPPKNLCIQHRHIIFKVIWVFYNAFLQLLNVLTFICLLVLENSGVGCKESYPFQKGIKQKKKIHAKFISFKMKKKSLSFNSTKTTKRQWRILQIFSIFKYLTISRILLFSKKRDCSKHSPPLILNFYSFQQKQTRGKLFRDFFFHIIKDEVKW